MCAYGDGFREWYTSTLPSPTNSLANDAFSITAGGQAVNSRMERMLTVVPEHIHDRSGIFLGSYDEVEKVIETHRKHAK